MAFLSRFFRNPAIAVDFGTAKTRVAWGTLPVLESPSMMDGRYTLHCGVVVDRDAAVAVARNRCVKYILQKRLELNDIESKVLEA